ncbi:MAG: MBL fold metallo-hydrolase [Planctomycetota bacterium]|jgi:ribonuclease Z|nr:MBL fold metallo-hydrolase [Planctomycetota bacterium]MDP7251601.1 MBL fold metallo-hydrolase [Planctomycetota bacterium]
MKILFVGTGGFEPEIGSDSPCILVNGRYLVDTGWNCVFKLKQYRIDPRNLTTFFISHFHPDHYLGLAGLLFFIGVRTRDERPNRQPLTIVGPDEFLHESVQRTQQFLQWDNFPELQMDLDLVPLASGDIYENDEILVEAIDLSHTTTLSEPGRPIMSLGYIFREKDSGASCVTAWDTSCNPGIVEAIRNTPVLIHDIGHTSPRDAARIGKMAKVGRLFLIHFNGDGEELLREARELLPETYLAVEGNRVEL